MIVLKSVLTIAVDLSPRSDVWEHKILTRGVWIINQSGSFYTGMIVNFQNFNEKFKLKRQDKLNL